MEKEQGKIPQQNQLYLIYTWLFFKMTSNGETATCLLNNSAI